MANKLNPLEVRLSKFRTHLVFSHFVLKFGAKTNEKVGFMELAEGSDPDASLAEAKVGLADVWLTEQMFNIKKHNGEEKLSGITYQLEVS